MGWDPSVAFGVSNGVLTVVAVVASMWVTGTPRRHIATALLALLITDPISDSYSLFEGERSGTKGDTERMYLFRRTLLSKVCVQLVFIAAVLAVPSAHPNLMMAVVVAVGGVLTVVTGVYGGGGVLRHLGLSSLLVTSSVLASVVLKRSA